jgi:SAM-dependent methyltransferase
MRSGLGKKSFDLIFNKDNTMPFLADSSVDVVWVLSVFNHMPDDELATSLAAIHRVLRPGGLFFCYYSTPETSAKTLKTFARGNDDMGRRLQELGFSFRLLDDWDDDLVLRDSVMLLASR